MSSRAGSAAIGAALLFAAGGLSSQEGAGGLPPESVLELQIPEDPRLSPDGSRIAYVRRFADRDGREYTSIFVEPTAGGAVERVTDGPRVDRAPRFSPDGRRIAWIAFSDGFWEIRVRDLATRRQRELAAGSLPPGSIAWSPTGDRIAFTRVLPDPGEATGPVHVFVVPAAGGAPRRVTSERLARGGLALDGRLAWTETGASIVLSAAPDGDRDIYELELTTGLDRKIADRDGPDIDPAVSPTGELVAFTGPPDGAEDGPHALFVADRLGSGPPRTISRSLRGSVRNPVWAPDGGGVYALVEAEDGERRLVYVRLDGTSREVADRVDGRSFDVSGDAATARFTYVSSRPDRAPEIYVGLQSSSFPGEAVTALNYGVDGGRFGRAAFVSVPRPDGGEDILLTAVLPPGVDGVTDVAGRALIVDARGKNGRPESFDIVRQVLAGAGAVVLIATDPEGAVPALRSLVGEGRVFADRVFLLESRSDAIGPRDVEPFAVEAPYAAGIDWGTASWRAGSPADRVAKLGAALEWLRSRTDARAGNGAG